MIDLCFTAGKRIRVINYHTTRGNRKTIIFASYYSVFVSLSSLSSQYSFFVFCTVYVFSLVQDTDAAFPPI
jgi:hypothetical protein